MAHSFLPWLAATALLTAACVDPADDLAEIDDAIIGGQVASPEATGVVKVHTTAPGHGLCTGTLITNRWVLTAKHCVRAPGAAAPVTPDKVVVALGGRVVHARELVTFPDDTIVGQLWRVDVALIRLDAPLPMDGRTGGFARPIYAGDSASLHARSLTCLGYGFFTPGANAGTLHSATLVAHSLDSRTYEVEPNASGQITDSGDSGGPCFLDGAITGVQSGVAHKGQVALWGVQAAAAAFRDWLAATIYQAPRDLDGDHRSDLLWRDTTTGDAWIDRLDGTFFHGDPIQLGAGIPLDWLLLGTGDLDNDGDDDLLWRNLVSGDVVSSTLDGMVPVSGAVLPTLAGQWWELVGLADLDRDGDDDVVWRDAETEMIKVWVIGASIVLEELDFALPHDWTMVGVADLDANGAAEMLMRQIDISGGVLTWELGDDSLGAISEVAPAVWDLAGTGDLDRDGRTDLVWRDWTTGALTHWLMHGDVVTAVVPVAAVRGLEWELISVGDVDGDRDADVVWRDVFGGLISVWRLEAGQLVQDGGPGVRPLDFRPPAR